MRGVAGVVVLVGLTACAHAGTDEQARLNDPSMTSPTVTSPARSSAPAGDGPATPGVERAQRAKLEDTSNKRASFEMGGYADTEHVSVLTPSISGGVENVTDGASIHGSYLVDVVTAASVDIVSTASRRWREVRHAGSIDGKYRIRSLSLSLAGSLSSEPDYLSYGGVGNLSYDLNEKNTTLFFGFGYGHDIIGRSDTPFTVFSRIVNRGSFLGGLEQVLDKSSIVSMALDVIVENGDQSKPYRYIPMFARDVAGNVPVGATIEYVTGNRLPERPLEQLPLGRHRFALASSYARRFDASTIRLEERVYTDTWGLKATTSDARWFFDLSRRVSVWPHGRLHLQTPVTFWQRAYVSGPGWDLPEFRTGDRELGPLWTATGGGGLKVYLGSAATPRTFAIGVHGDVMFTKYLDDLYLTKRTGGLGVLTFEVQEP